MQFKLNFPIYIYTLNYLNLSLPKTDIIRCFAFRYLLYLFSFFFYMLCIFTTFSKSPNKFHNIFLYTWHIPR